MRSEVVDKSEKECTPAKLGLAGTTSEEYADSSAEFGAKMTTKIISYIAKIVHEHKGVTHLVIPV